MKRNPITNRSRVLIIDDHPAVREALAFRIALQPDMEVCGEATDIPDALQMIAEKKPDLAVIDITLKSGNGIDLIKRIKDRNDRVKMLVWSMHAESLYAERALRAGALGYINKDQATDKIIDAIKRVLEGRVYLSEAMAERLLHRSVGGSRVESGHALLEALADRELEVFRLIGQGHRTAEIAEQLHLSVKTVETYRDRIRQKLNLKNGTELVHFATRWVVDSKES